ncbi:hypothetical protein HYC85_000759 [Camellia sinensis]|uniref:Uncharacterized protein n=1 Tax=Camellia sinensis TaxID=4442 RepID=A0A7J7I3E4_CAMSI|nr:hypothetical protein HYC85_000759 [Camellia sinensis]
MNYLPMLSHQQLLYLLTMSFVSRVPRSLMPGARKSRLRDCQKEERELSVKKAFLEDILSENNLLTILLGKNSSYHAVLWDLESLPSPSKESERCIATVVTTPREDVCSENKNIETMDDLYVNDADFSCDFEVDSRTLACVACGILGFPFMCVVQPSERVSMSLLQDVGVSKPLGCHSHPVLHDMIEGFISDGMKDKIEQNESNVLHHQNGAFSSAKSIKSTACSSEDLSSVPDLFPPPGDLPVSLEVKFDKGWSATRGFLRPRIFCLEHAIQIEEMLRSKGGANFFVICHSDFQKMKAHAAVIAEEIGSPFGYNEIPLDNASQEGLNLIDLAIDDEEHDECGEDWTSKLSINLWHCVKDEVWGAESDGIMVRREGELIQYSRRFKSKPGDSAAASKIFEHPAKHMHNEVSVTNSGGPDESNKNNEKNHAEKSADASEGQCNIQSDGDVLMKEAPNLVNTMNTDEVLSSLENCSSHDKIELENTGFTMVCPRSTAQNGRKRRIDVELQTEDQLDFNCFIKSPCERLRPRAAKDSKISGIDSNSMFEDKPAVKSVRKSSNDFLSRKNKKKNENVKGSHRSAMKYCFHYQLQPPPTTSSSQPFPNPLCHLIAPPHPLMPLSQARKGLEVAIGTMEGWMVVAGAVNGLGRVATGQSQWQWRSRGRGGKVKIWLGMAKCPDPPGPRLPLTLIRWV